jgi:hypothetical protein
VRLTRSLAVLAAALAGAAGTVAVAPPALAVAPTIVATAVCDEATATYTVTWTVTNATETPATINRVIANPPAPIGTFTGIAVGDVVPPAAQGSLTATATVHSYLRQNTTLQIYLDGGFQYSKMVALPVCGNPVMPIVSFTSDCDYLTLSVSMPAGGYPVQILTSPASDPELAIVQPGAAAQTVKWRSPDEEIFTGMAYVGQLPPGRWEPEPTCTAPVSLGLFQLFANINFRYVVASASASPGRVDQAMADEVRSNEEALTNFEFLDAGDGYIAIRQPEQNLLLTYFSDAAPLGWSWDGRVGDPQRFRLVKNADGTVSLTANLNGKYVTAEKAGARPLYANRTAIGPWEKFTQYAANSGPGTINAIVNNLNVTAESAGRKPLIANRMDPARWEFFYVENLGNDEVALRSLVNGKYVCAESAGKKELIANRTTVGPWETFKVVRNGDGSESLKAKANGKYVTAESAGRKPLIANRTAIGPWEKFNLYGFYGATGA